MLMVSMGIPGFLNMLAKKSDYFVILKKIIAVNRIENDDLWKVIMELNLLVVLLAPMLVAVVGEWFYHIQKHIEVNVN